MMRTLAILAVLAASACFGQDSVAPYSMQLPSETRVWFRNPDGSCVQCSIGMCGVWQNVPPAYSLLWDTEFGSKVRGGSGPSRVEAYAEKRSIPVFNVTGSSTWEWMRWAAKTRRFAAIGAGSVHFQTLYGWNPQTNKWFVCNNNSPTRVDEYTWDQFRRLHLASGQWIVVLDKPPPAPVPQYARWW